MPKTIIISASTGAYFPLLDEMLSSLEPAAKRDGMDIGILDLGLGEGQRQNLRQRNVLMAVPPWDYDLSRFTQPPPPHFKAMTARPHLPKYFPGYEMYMWIDADCWVQRWDAAQLYLAAAATKGFACTPECDRSYVPFLTEMSVLAFALKCFRGSVDENAALSLAQFPMINSGVFAARADAPHWEKWSMALGEALGKRNEADFFVEQTALNIVVRTGRLATALLPSWCNWICHRALPICTADGSTFLDPQPPHQPLGIIHLTGNFKTGLWNLRSVLGDSRECSLRFGASRGSR